MASALPAHTSGSSPNVNVATTRGSGPGGDVGMGVDGGGGVSVGTDVGLAVAVGWTLGAAVAVVTRASGLALGAAEGVGAARPQAASSAETTITIASLFIVALFYHNEHQDAKKKPGVRTESFPL
jgi:hypothetical protein